MASSVKVVPLIERSSLYAVSLLALSVQARSMRLEETAVAVRFVGAAGTGSVVADTTFV